MAEVRADVAELLRAGDSYASIEAALGVSRDYLVKTRKQLGLPPRRASRASQEWNQGRAGQTPPTAVLRPVGLACTTERCGELAEGRKPNGFTRVHVPDSREPGRWYCSPGCAAYGQALAEIRAIPLPEPAQP